MSSVNSKTFFQIRPTHYNYGRPIMFCNQGFRLEDIKLISEPVMSGKLSYKFFVYIGYTEDFKLEFEFEKKTDCVIAQRELCRAWTRTGEFEIKTGEDNASE